MSDSKAMLAKIKALEAEVAIAQAELEQANEEKARLANEISARDVKIRALTADVAAAEHRAASVQVPAGDGQVIEAVGFTRFKGRLWAPVGLVIRGDKVVDRRYLDVLSDAPNLSNALKIALARRLSDLHRWVERYGESPEAPANYVVSRDATKTVVTGGFFAA